LPIKTEREKDNIVIYRVSGELSKAEFDLAQNTCEKFIKITGTIKILVLVDNFTGWERTEGWEDISFADRNDPLIEKMAIVCAKKWQDDMQMFTLKGYRKLDMEFFDQAHENEARLWLNRP
jgi:hypothetical protein